MTENLEASPRAGRTVAVIIGILFIFIGVIGVGLSVAAWIAIPDGAVRTAALTVESDECPILVLERPTVNIEISGYEWLQELAALQPIVEISSAGSIFTIPTETLPELVLGVKHCRLVESDTWKVVTVPGVNRGLDSSSTGMATVEKSPHSTAVFTSGGLESGSLIIKDPGEVKVQGLLVAPWSTKDVQLIAVLAPVMMIIGVLIVILGLRSRSKGKHESHE